MFSISRGDALARMLRDAKVIGMLNVLFYVTTTNSNSNITYRENISLNILQYINTKQVTL